MEEKKEAAVRIEKCIEMLNKMLNGDLTAQQVIDMWPRDTQSDLIEDVYSHLFHYRDDEDIREKDYKYKTWQDEEIKKNIDSLRALATKVTGYGVD